MVCLVYTIVYMYRAKAPVCCILCTSCYCCSRGITPPWMCMCRMHHFHKLEIGKRKRHTARVPQTPGRACGIACVIRCPKDTRYEHHEWKNDTYLVVGPHGIVEQDYVLADAVVGDVHKRLHLLPPSAPLQEQQR